MFNADINLSAASDASIQQYADHVFEYDSNRRVTLETSAVCSSCPGGGTTQDRFIYTASGWSPGFNSWQMKTQQILRVRSANPIFNPAF